MFGGLIAFTLNNVGNISNVCSQQSVESPRLDNDTVNNIKNFVNNLSLKTQRFYDYICVTGSRFIVGFFMKCVN